MRNSLTHSFVFALVLGTAFAADQPHFVGVPAKDHVRHNPLDGKPDAITAGGTLYRDHCAQCHQADAKGDGKKKPSLRSAEVRSASDGDLEWFLRQGDLRHGMPSWSSLTQAQRWAIINYLRSLQ
jgi:cytochrome c oxidase cbb3-type subunit 2